MNWEKKAVEKSARHELWRSIMLHKKAGMTQWQFIKMVMEMWENPEQGMTDLILESIDDHANEG